MGILALNSGLWNLDRRSVVVLAPESELEDPDEAHDNSRSDGDETDGGKLRTNSVSEVGNAVLAGRRSSDVEGEPEEARVADARARELGLHNSHNLNERVHVLVLFGRGCGSKHRGVARGEVGVGS